MSDVEVNEPLRFYLKHKSQIDEWIKLPDLERQKAAEFFRSVADPLEQRLKECAGKPELMRVPEDKYPRFLAHLPQWLTDEDPVVSVGLERTSDAGFKGSYVGIRVLDKDLGARISERLSSIDLGCPHSSRYWPLWRYVVPESEEYWEDLTAFGDQIIESHVALWESTWEVIDQVFRDWAGASVARSD